MAASKLAIRYVPLSEVELWPENPKKHDIGSIIQSLQKNGMRDAPAQDDTLGGIVTGNGRIEALRQLHAAGEEPPEGIVQEGNDWLVPLQVGMNSATRHQAEAYGIDHNAITVLGGDLGLDSVMGLFDETLLKNVLLSMPDFPISVDGEDLDALLADEGHGFQTEPAYDLIVECGDEGTQIGAAELLRDHGYSCRPKT